VVKVPSKGKEICAYVPYDIWEKLTLLAYVRQLEGRASGDRTLAATKSRIILEALKEHFERHPELEKEIARAKEVYHVEIEGGDQGA
jgi:hypothetical protein